MTARKLERCCLVGENVVGVAGVVVVVVVVLVVDDVVVLRGDKCRGASDACCCQDKEDDEGTSEAETDRKTPDRSLLLLLLLLLLLVMTVRRCSGRVVSGGADSSKDAFSKLRRDKDIDAKRDDELDEVAVLVGALVLAEEYTPVANVGC